MWNLGLHGLVRQDAMGASAWGKEICPRQGRLAAGQAPKMSPA